MNNLKNQKTESEFLNQLEEYGHVYFKAKGRSMLPFFPSGTIFFIKNVSFEQIAIGDIVLSMVDNDIILHRLIFKNDQKRTYVTKGDFLEEPDLEFDENQLLGKAVAIIRKNRTISLNGPLVSLSGVVLARFSSKTSLIFKILRTVKSIFR